MKNIAADTPVRQIFDVYRGAVLPILLKDKTTDKNILWATDEYDVISPKSEIEFKDITGGSLMLVRPRIAKTLDAQRDRTKKRAEVFTPSWICNQMNNALDDDYLGYTGAFNTEGDKAWTRNRKKIQFSDGKTWQEYVDQTRLEITCGEAPFVTSRYNPTDGNFIEVKDRIGFLDRKLRVVERMRMVTNTRNGPCVPAHICAVGLYFRGYSPRFTQIQPPKTAPQCRPKGSLSLM